MRKEVLLSVGDLHVTYRSSTGVTSAVRGVDFEIYRGETLGLAGESGCGKSSLAMSVMRLVEPTTKISGSIKLLGEEVLQMKQSRLRAVRWAKASIVFQGAQHVLNPVQRIGAQIDEAIQVHTGNARVSELLKQVGLGVATADYHPHQLSGGQKQRVMIAMALACDPLLIIADEPTTALDVMVQEQILQLLGNIKRERELSVLFITHDLSVLTHNSDRIAIMYAGRIVEIGPAADFLTRSEHPYAKALANSFPVIGDVFSRHNPRGLVGDPPDPRAIPLGCPFHPRCVESKPECQTTDVMLKTVDLGDSIRQIACVNFTDHGRVS